MDGILCVYKPAGITSFDVIREFKRAVHPDYKIGHGGTLDPFADGVLLLLLGKATKQMNSLSELPKTYRATAVLGEYSDTLDSTGSISTTEWKPFTPEDLEQVRAKFVGVIEQVIPDYSAAKINGVPRYKLARKGETMEQKSKPVTIHSLVIEKIENKLITFVTTVSSGTYIRQLSYDIFRSLGVESYLTTLTRTAIGESLIDRCVAISDFSSSKWQDMVVQRVPLAHDA